MGRIPSNHRLAERKLIALVKSGEWKIDEQGRIWRISVRKGLKNGGSHLILVKKRRIEKILPSGYLMVRAMIDGKRVVGQASRLVWQYFYGDIPEGMVINHKNGFKDDNRPKNLEVTTYSGNIQHAHKYGLLDQSGQRNPNAKLTNKQVAEIRLVYATEDYTQEQLAKKYDVSFQCISKIVRGESRARQPGKTGDYRHLRQRNPMRDPITGRFVGKKAAGRLLDGREWDEYPENPENKEAARQ